MRSLILLLLLMTATCLMAQVTLASCYHTYPEIEEYLNYYQTTYPDQAKIYTIGFSQVDHVPIYAMKISNNVNVDEDEPELLFVGQVHAEEVLGTEIVLSNIKEILTHQSQIPYITWLASSELWFIPTMNPEGYNVVMDGLDVTYRKNKRDNNNNGVFDFATNQGPGYDIDGVDPNRNFSFNWIHGDSLYATTPPELYDYYRGSAPFSENESKAIRDFAAQHHIVFSINWHSSRTGNFSEQIFYSYDWYNSRPSPDLDIAQQIGNGVASQIPKQTDPGNYEPSATQSKRGSTNDWFYQAHGTQQLLVECGTRDLQPDSTVMVGTVQRCTQGVAWMINRAMRYGSATIPHSMLTGRIEDATTGQPLVAEVIVEERKAPYLAPRLSDALYGRFWRPLVLGTYNVTIQKKGYQTLSYPNVVVNNSTWTTLPNSQPNSRILLTPLPVAHYAGTVRGNGNPIAAQIIVYDNPPDTIYTTDGTFSFQTYEGSHLIQVTADGYFPYIDTLQVAGGQYVMNFDLSSATTLFSENWENGTSQWTVNGPWVLENVLSHNGYAITDSWGGLGFYAVNCDVNITTAASIFLPQLPRAYLTFWQNLYTEWEYDFARVEISTNGTEWTPLYTQSGQYDTWHPVYISLDQYMWQPVYLRFRLTDQSNNTDLVDPGWTLDDIKVIIGSSTMTETNDPSVPPKPIIALYSNYPNPFNPETTIRFSILNTSTKNAKINIYNIRGQRVKEFLLTNQQIRDGKITWDAADQASGIYFYSLDIDGTRIATHKAVLVK